MASDPEDHRRHSIAAEPTLLTDPTEVAIAEARNALQQFDLGRRIVDDAIAKGDGFRWRSSALLSLHRAALNGFSSSAGVWRPAAIGISGSAHLPVGAHLVPEKIEEMCDYLNANRARPALHLSAYAMWRLNWIHPFTDGNGRTSRIFSYIVLCVRMGYFVPGTPTIPQQIVENRKPYFTALEHADQACAEGRVDVSKMEELIGNLLAVQLTNIYAAATVGLGQQEHEDGQPPL